MFREAVKRSKKRGEGRTLLISISAASILSISFFISSFFSHPLAFLRGQRTCNLLDDWKAKRWAEDGEKRSEDGLSWISSQEKRETDEGLLSFTFRHSFSLSPLSLSLSLYRNHRFTLDHMSYVNLEVFASCHSNFFRNSRRGKRKGVSTVADWTHSIMSSLLSDSHHSKSSILILGRKCSRSGSDETKIR